MPVWIDQPIVPGARQVIVAGASIRGRGSVWPDKSSLNRRGSATVVRQRLFWIPATDTRDVRQVLLDYLFSFGRRSGRLCGMRANNFLAAPQLLVLDRSAAKNAQIRPSHRRNRA